MTQPQTSAPITPITGISPKVGISVLAIIVALVAAWLQVQSKLLGGQSAAPSLPSMSNVDLARFRADAWYLPADALLGFVEIPAGAFVMGSDPAVDDMAFENERWSDDRRQGSIALPAYYIGRYEVTVAQFTAFAAASGYQADKLALTDTPNNPAVNVSWTDALAYARWLEAQLRQSTLTPAPLLQHLNEGWHITLPNEAQWEKAARGTDGRIFPWGNIANREYANFRSATAMPVGTLNCPQCAFGLSDMSGNVWELTRSAYRSYPFDATRAPDLKTKALYVMRGGSFNDEANTVRAAVRGGIDPGARRPFIGFRVVLTKN